MTFLRIFPPKIDRIINRLLEGTINLIHATTEIFSIILNARERSMRVLVTCFHKKLCLLS